MLTKSELTNSEVVFVMEILIKPQKTFCLVVLDSIILIIIRLPPNEYDSFGLTSSYKLGHSQIEYH